ncbi:UDP-glucuronosyltransferase 2B15-like [Notamacropus eugenii]|uniref:UDP-glucuronosyltransferase 2B15-like n=1 Tax=Notamacropus eugenii TaxID=9315 RepID=UPI003B67DBB5
MNLVRDEAGTTMNLEKWISALLLLQLWCFSCESCGKVLVWPMEYSHWMNLKNILDGLVQRGHEVTVLTPSATVFFDPDHSSGFHVEVFPVEISQEDLVSVFENSVLLWSYELRMLLALEYGAALQKQFFEYSRLAKLKCESAVFSKDLRKTLKKAKYEVVLEDAFSPYAELIAEIVGIPFIYSLSLTMSNTYGKYCGGLSLPPSYVPVPLTTLTDKMMFMEQVKNILFFIYLTFGFRLLI